MISMSNCMYERNIFGTSSEVFGNPQLSSEIFGNLRRFRKRPSDNVWRIFENLRKMVGNLLKIAKDVIFSMFFSCSTLYPTREISSCIEHSKRNDISMRANVLFSM